ncbi:hypothetical protein LR48_Vigan01g312400 [Vigna angularis]|uniref:Uncharacterized protein n=1 Tax=Phaseolus angularis TaxID=3914 RepID=A0A0L9TSK5_PHAAN|nr:hypothetical protein LR48_Vigan01g312400 [Vigna angularis]
MSYCGTHFRYDSELARSTTRFRFPDSFVKYSSSGTTVSATSTHIHLPQPFQALPPAVLQWRDLKSESITTVDLVVPVSVGGATFASGWEDVVGLEESRGYEDHSTVSAIKASIDKIPNDFKVNADLASRFVADIDADKVEFKFKKAEYCEA